jgi:hypothetical protein
MHFLIPSTPLFYILAPTRFGSSMPLSGSSLDPSELLENQIEWLIYHMMCGYVTVCRFVAVRSGVYLSRVGWDTHTRPYHDIPTHRSRNHTLYDISTTKFDFKVTHKDLSCFLIMACYCRNM